MKNIKFAAVALGIFIPFLAVWPALESQGKKGTWFDNPLSIWEAPILTQANALLPLSSPNAPETIVSTIHVVVTAYSSTPEQTDDTPFITASGTYVRNGIVAANMLPMGTKIKIPTLYGDRIFVVEDRMHPRNSQNVDIWFPTYWEAKSFGVRYTHIEILAS